MKTNPYIYIIIMATVTYAIRLIPLTLIKKEINNNFVKSFLYFIPYVTLAVMTFPSILNSTSSKVGSFGGFMIAMLMAYKGQSLFKVSSIACVTVFIIELLLLLRVY